VDTALLGRPFVVEADPPGRSPRRTPDAHLGGGRTMRAVRRPGPPARLLGLSLLLAGAASHADNCEAVRSGIESKYRAAGLQDFRVVAVDRQASAAGRTVGSCANGSRKIVFSATRVTGPTPPGAAPRTAPAAAPRATPHDDILTECRDGTASVGGSCGR
jgi:hypothetical protein